MIDEICNIKRDKSDKRCNENCSKRRFIISKRSQPILYLHVIF